jgi:hypothetical protein
MVLALVHILVIDGARLSWNFLWRAELLPRSLHRILLFTTASKTEIL